MNIELNDLVNTLIIFYILYIMNSLFKFIIYFLLGIIVYFLLFNDNRLIEGLNTCADITASGREDPFLQSMCAPNATLKSSLPTEPCADQFAACTSDECCDVPHTGCYQYICKNKFNENFQKKINNKPENFDSCNIHPGTCDNEICCDNLICGIQNDESDSNFCPLNKTLLKNLKCDTLEQCKSKEYCCSINVPEEIENLFNDIKFGNTSYDENHYMNISQHFKNNPDLDLNTFQLNEDTIKAIKYYSQDKFLSNWVGSGGEQEETGKNVWLRMINTIKKLDPDYDPNGHYNPEDMEKYIKQFLIMLDKPDPSNENMTPINILLHGKGVNINVSQFEALL